MRVIIRYILLCMTCIYGCLCSANVLYAQEASDSDNTSAKKSDSKKDKETIVNLTIDGTKKSSSKSSKSTSSKSSKSSGSKSSKNSSSKNS